MMPAGPAADRLHAQPSSRQEPEPSSVPPAGGGRSHAPTTPGQGSANGEAAGRARRGGTGRPARQYHPGRGRHLENTIMSALTRAGLVPRSYLLTTQGRQDRPAAPQSGGPGRARRAAVAGPGLRAPCAVLNELVFPQVKVSPGPVGGWLDDGTGTCLVASGAEAGARLAVVPPRPADGLLWLAPGPCSRIGGQVLRRVPLRGRRGSRSARRRLRSTGAWPGRGLAPRAGTGSRVRAATAAA